MEDVADVAGTQPVTPGLRQGSYLLASNNDASAIGLQNSGDEIEKRRFSGAALPLNAICVPSSISKWGMSMWVSGDLQAKRKPFGG